MALNLFPDRESITNLLVFTEFACFRPRIIASAYFAAASDKTGEFASRSTKPQALKRRRRSSSKRVNKTECTSSRLAIIRPRFVGADKPQKSSVAKYRIRLMERRGTTVRRYNSYECTWGFSWRFWQTTRHRLRNDIRASSSYECAKTFSGPPRKAAAAASLAQLIYY